MAGILSEAARYIQSAVADFLIICTNTMHKVAPQILNEIDIPLLHIADTTAETIVGNGLEKVGLPGTMFTMEQDFYKSRLIDRYGLDVIVPDKNDRQVVHEIIYEELCLGKIKGGSKSEFL